MLTKYPKTPHLQWSPGLKNDDTLFTGTFEGKEVVVTEKMDGENTTLYRDYIHARSLDSRHHSSRDWIKAAHGAIKSGIPKDWRVCGENLYAQHSIRYEELPSYFMVFAVFDDCNVCLDWNAVEAGANLLGFPTVPVLYKGIWDLQSIKQEWASLPHDSEGYVVRVAEAFHLSQFHQNVAKYVRRDHIQTDQHWMSKPVVPNGTKQYP
jgi:hypothetical protein